jgi:hypothetical protein
LGYWANKPLLSVCIISVIRLPALHLAATTPDPTWNNIGVANWSCIELNAAITCASLSTLKPLVSSFFPNLLPSVENPDCNYFTTGVDMESGKSARETVGESTIRSNSTGMMESDTDMIYKEENFGGLERKGTAVDVSFQEVEDIKV